MTNPKPRDTRGFLNNNPGNMDRGTVVWNGEVRDVASAQNTMQIWELTTGRFCVFVSAVLGIRAMAKNLRAYHSIGDSTIRQYIDRWAPPIENDTAAYIAAVAERVGVSADERVDIEQYRVMSALVDAIIRVECAGMPYDGDEIKDGLALAGIVA